ncbi:hypothetical protein [Cumulibacter manganitolerans]|nr:hypothetical protein [Cumulibacter manganitolerans]
MLRREFDCPADFTTQLGDWLKLANARVVRTIQGLAGRSARG